MQYGNSASLSFTFKGSLLTSFRLSLGAAAAVSIMSSVQLSPVQSSPVQFSSVEFCKQSQRDAKDTGGGLAAGIGPML